MNDIDKTTDERLQIVRDSFNLNDYQWMNKLTRDLIISAINAKIKEIVLLHDFRAKRCQGGYKGNKEIIEGDIVAKRLAIEPGAKFTGSCSMSDENVQPKAIEKAAEAKK